jgi:hypothetical protein
LPRLAAALWFPAERRSGRRQVFDLREELLVGAVPLTLRIVHGPVRST